MNSLTPMTFDYSLLTEDFQGELIAAADRIRKRTRRAVTDIIENGRDLLAIKSELNRGQFLGWIKAEFAWSERAAEYYMALAREWGDVQVATVATLPVKLLYDLSAKSTPPEIKAEVRADLDAGKPVDAKAVKAKIRDAAKARRQKVEQAQHSVETITTPVVTDVATTEHIFDRHFGPLSGEEWTLLAWDCRRGTGRGKSRRHFYSDQFMKLVAFHSVPLADLEAVE